MSLTQTQPRVNYASDPQPRPSREYVSNLLQDCADRAMARRVAVFIPPDIAQRLQSPRVLHLQLCAVTAELHKHVTVEQRFREMLDAEVRR